MTSAGTDNARDIHNWFLYDARGLVRATIDGEGGLTRMSYNPLGELSFVETGQKLDPLTLIATPPTLATLPGAGGAILRTATTSATPSAMSSTRRTA